MIDQTTADTLNKALDLAKQGVVAGFETVKTYAPYVWGMARRQTILEGIELVVVWVIIAVFYVGGNVWLSKRNLPTGDYRTFGCSDRNIARVVTALIFVTFTIIVAINAIDFLANPDFWTMHKILDLIGGRR